MTEYTRLRAMARWREEQLDVVAFLNQWSSRPWALAMTADGIGQIVRVGSYDYPIALVTR